MTLGHIAGLTPGRQMKVLRTGQIGRIESIDMEWARLFPHKGPMLVINLGDERRCFSLCDLEPVHLPLHRRRRISSMRPM